MLGDATSNLPHHPPDPDASLTIGGSSTPVNAPVSINTTRHLPTTIGRYRIVRLLGEGGMGAVYEAEQDQPRRSVALKVIKTVWASPEALRRFEQEFQTLGRLHHPGIAQIYEAGTADTGFGSQPFFAMEIIHGKPLTDYADAHHLNTRQRLALMIQVCEAVEHAHQRGIIHRDLKPGNILVDENGQPKILDFGLARVTDSDAQATRQTDMGQLLGTLAYMSPEQVLADPLALDTRSDVYALGVILYELRVLGPEHPDTLATAELLAICLSHEKQYARAKGLVQEAIQKASHSPEQSSLALAWYNSACVEAVAAHKGAALQYLQKAADLGSGNVLTMASDEDLKSLRGDPRFTALIANAKVKDRAAAQASK